MQQQMQHLKNQAERHTWLSNALSGCAPQHNHVGGAPSENNAPEDNAIGENVVRIEALAPNNVAPAGPMAKVDEALIKRYNQCKLKEFKGVSGVTVAED